MERPGFVAPGLPLLLNSFWSFFGETRFQRRVRLVIVVVMAVVMVVAMVFVIPVAFVDLPSLPIVVVVGMGPIGARIGWPLPDAGDPDVAVAVHSPIAVDPDESR